MNGLDQRTGTGTTAGTTARADSTPGVGKGTLVDGLSGPGSRAAMASPSAEVGKASAIAGPDVDPAGAAPRVEGSGSKDR